ncbi:prolyl oligopeptidase family serine peptidase, partial [Escherichia coli]|nr:prolyl oligopeptidase family serine peptidase [Escherichia coli]
LDRGFVFAIAHIRGSEMLGRPWYEDGKKLTKQNTFNDFIDVTKGLVEQGYGAKDKVFAVGGSAGGLLMGAIINQAPELYCGIGAHVPFVDVV